MYHTYMVRGGYLSSPEEGAAGGKAGGMYAAGGKAGGMYAGAGYDDDQSSGDERSVYKTAGPSVYSRRDTAGPVEKRGPVREPVLESSVIDVEQVHERAAQLVSYFQALLVGRKTQLENEKHENASLAAELAKAREGIKALRKENAALIKENAALSKRKDFRDEAKKSFGDLKETLRSVKSENNLFRAAHKAMLTSIAEREEGLSKKKLIAWANGLGFPKYSDDAEEEDLLQGCFSEGEEGEEETEG